MSQTSILLFMTYVNNGNIRRITCLVSITQGRRAMDPAQGAVWADAAARLPTRQVAAWAQCLMQARPQIREWTQARIWAWAKAAAAATGNGTATGAATAPQTVRKLARARAVAKDAAKDAAQDAQGVAACSRATASQVRPKAAAQAPRQAVTQRAITAKVSAYE